MKPVKLAIVGAGLIGRRHMELVSVSTECTLVAVCDADPARAATAEEFGVPFYQSLKALLSENTPQGAIIATPTDRHAAAGLACAEHGIHLLVEKPITANLAEAKRFLDFAGRCGVQALVGHHRRHNPLSRRARAIDTANLATWWLCPCCGPC